MGKIKVHELVYPEDLPAIRTEIFAKIKNQKSEINNLMLLRLRNTDSQ